MSATGTLARVYLLVVAATATVAVIVLALLAGPARSVLGFTFPGVPATLSDALSIFLANLRIMVVAFAGCFVQQWPWLGGDARGRTWRVACVGADVLIGGLVTMNVLVVGSSIGGYGGRMVRAVLPHAPVELLAFSSAVTLYMLSRRGRLDRRDVAWFGAGAVVALAVAAGVETFLGAAE